MHTQPALQQHGYRHQRGQPRLRGHVRAPLLRALATLTLCATSVEAAEPGGGGPGTRLVEAIAKLEQRGAVILYSTDLVRPWMRVGDAPQATEPRSVLAEIVAPHGLDVRDGPNGTWLLVRAAPARRVAPASGDTSSSVAMLEEVVVTTSRYRLMPETAAAVEWSVSDLERLPDIGDDPLRAVARLPGAATGDFSAKASIRGGEADETLVRFDGLRLFNPFHFKDFHSIFSTIDPAIVRRMEVYTGAFPAAFGDRMSGVIDIESLAAANVPQRELALSFFNASGRLADSFNAGRGEWLLSARRSNLSLLLDGAGDERGDPRYTDLYARLGHQLSDALSLTGSVLRFHDDLELNDSDFEEQAAADYRDEYGWARVDYEPGPDVRGTALLARSQLESTRRGTVQQPGVATGELDDRRRFVVDSLQTDWILARSPSLAFTLGAEWRRFEGRYDYRDEVEFDVLLLTPGAPTGKSRTRELSARPSGHQLGAYASARVQALPTLTADIGLRWDRESLSPSGGTRWSPRVGLRWDLHERTSLRGAWGRYVQSQSISELPISDGADAFEPPQRAEHWVGSLEHATGHGVKLRIEGYHKEYADLRPRYENLLNDFVLLPELRPDRIRVAPASATAQGIELTLGNETPGPLKWWLTYAWSSVRDDFADRETDRSWDQTHAVGAGVAWQHGPWDLSLAGRYRTGWPTTKFELVATDPVPLLGVGARNAARLDDYLALDARVARKFQLERSGEITVFLEVSNLLNHRNECCVEYEFNDEEGEPGLEAEKMNYMPAFPSLGIIWRF